MRSSSGSVTVVAPANRAGESYEFPGSGNTQPGIFSGAVRFVAHGGLLDVVLANPMLEWASETGSLTVASRLVGSGPRYEIARLTDAKPQDDGGVAADVRLTVLGSRLFGEVYPPGASLDPVLVTGSVDA